LSRRAHRPLRVVAVAEEAAGVQTLRTLLALPEPPTVVAVLTTSPEEAARRPLVHEAAQALGLETWPADAVRSTKLARLLRNHSVDLLLNVHSLFVVRPDVVAAPRIGSFNLHPGPLPEYAGLNAPSWAVYHGERTHAVTVHWMDAGVDTGPIAYSASFDVLESDTGLALAGKCVRHGIPLIVQLVRDASLDWRRIPRFDQDLQRRRYFGRSAPRNGRIDWSCRAAEIARFVRAADYAPFPSPWGHPTAELFGRTVGIAKATLTGRRAPGLPGTVHEVSDVGALVAAADELLLVKRIWIDGRYVDPRSLMPRRRASTM
jgi:methionyl-tRNA formyltransferase